jgi:hypothetical protein
MVCPLAFAETVLDLYHVTGAGGMTRVQNESDATALRMDAVFAILIEALNRGGPLEAVRVYREELERWFDDGVQYAKDTVGEWHGR